ncbi:hypothetical protein SAMN04488074_106136 [Lentzea albidocapillata subsp. violacea]|uniref:Uncharacterized protein n=1 Tax=Lentzea albidocapillata subsp. violacea TaxID=128104 RepID=A0A1G9D4G5_9PSEU|nr:hypothetical protein [Lentzea albidocapillata]SDK58733.1 hypothetical protein SAMN04488074_106136 [Lentzea albidocapillata subsp. violacea]
MEDLMKDLAQARPPVPEVDRDRMERDLARIVTLPQERPVRKQLVRRFAPLLVIGAVIVLAVVLLPAPPQSVQPAAPPKWWHELTRQTSLMIVGDPADPYAVYLDSKTDRWLAANQQVTVVQKDGDVTPFSLQRGGNEWEAAGKPETVPQVGGNHLVRIGPMKPAVQKTAVSGFQMSLHSQARLDSLESLPAEPQELRKALETIVGNDAYRIGSLAMELISSNVRDDQRRAAFELIKTLDGARFLGELTVLSERRGIGVAMAAPPTFQFTDVETQLVINPETGLPIIKRDVITTPQHGLAAKTAISQVEYLLLEQVAIEPIVPQDVPVNGEVESPIIER